MLLLMGLCSTIVLIGGTIDLNNLDNYANQTVPNYIQKDNTTAGNGITDAGATLGRVLFYDKELSANGTVSCASCHKQEFAFGDTAVLSTGLSGGLTGRQAMRLINSRFGDEVHFFWDERAITLEDQTTKPIQDHVEMGFSATNGDPDLDSLIRKLNTIDYYNQLFEFVYGDTIITEARMQNAMAQFIRSIQSFDSKFDVGRATAANDGAPFTNFTAQENQGKTLFLAPPPAGAGCTGCHRAPEFDIDSASLNNGVIAVAGSPGSIDLTNTRAPSLRDLFNSNGDLNTPLMHNGNFTNIQQVINHYNLVPQNPNNSNLDPRLQGPGGNLGLTQTEQDALIAFLKTLTGTDVYANAKWSDPFDTNGEIDVVLLNTSVLHQASLELEIYPNPTQDFLQLKLKAGNYMVNVMDLNGRVLLQSNINGSERLDLSGFAAQMLLIEVNDLDRRTRAVKRVIKQ